MRSKEVLAMSVLALAIMGTAREAVAQEKNWSVSLGLKGWFNNWSTFIVNDSTLTGTSVTEFTSESATAAFLPSLTFRYKDFFVNAGGYKSGTYNFPKSSQIINYAAPIGPSTVTTELSAKRTEWDLNFGWYFHPQVAVTVGYKNIKQEYTDTVSSPGLVYPEPTVTSTTTYKIPTIGLLGGAPLGGKWFMYGSGAYGPKLKRSYSTSSNAPDPDGWYGTAELGVGYAFSRSVTATLGYKTQVIHQIESVTNGPKQVGDDTTYGIIGGMNFTF